MQKSFLKKTLAGIISLTILSSSAYMTFAAEKLYDKKIVEPVTKGVEYQHINRLTAEGWQNINVLTVDMNSPNVRIEPISSTKEYGLKETTETIVEENGAVAGVNASYFGLAGNYSASFGLIKKDGNLVSISSDINKTQNDYASFMLDNQDNPSINFVSAKFEFLNNGVKNLDIVSMNKVTNMVFPMYFDKNAATSTADLDKRFQGLVKIVVENGYITYISQPGETVNTPMGDGYLIIISSSTYGYSKDKFAVGQTAEFKVTTNIDLSNIDMAISGASKILSGGNIVSEGVTFKTRQPRTAIGYSEGGDKLIIMTVDGRGLSIGASQQEIAELMKEFGAYEAMNFDGGGSTTMVAKTVSDNEVVLKNEVSDGSQRKVINALGVFNDGKDGELESISIVPSSDRIFIGDSIDLKVYEFDEYYNKKEVPIDQVELVSADPNGKFSGSKYTPGTVGKSVIAASYKGKNTTLTVDVMDVSSIKPSVDSINAELGQSIPLSFVGLNSEGYQGPITGVTVTSDLGVMEGNNFVPTKEGSGYLTCTKGNAVTYIKANIGGKTAPINSFENTVPINATVYPKDLKAEASYTTSNVVDGKNALMLKYTFKQSSETQAAYLNFDTPINIGSPSDLTLSVYGNNSGGWLRGKVVDATGKEVLVDFTKNINFDGYKDLTAKIPSGLSYPLKLETIYVANLSNQNTNEQVLYFDNLRGRLPINESVAVPESTKLTDPKNVSIGAREPGYNYVAVSGGVNYNGATKPAGYDAARKDALNGLSSISDMILFAGKGSIDGSGKSTLAWQSGYKFTEGSTASYVQMTAANGKLSNTNTWQWKTFENDIRKTDNKNIIIYLDKTPSNFTDKNEADLFKGVLNDLVKDGKNIFVISASGTSYWSNVLEGVRYINVPELFNSDGSVNKNYKYLVIKASENDMYYDVKSIY